MSAHKSIDRICIVIVAFTLVIALIFCNGQALGIGVTAHATGYENRIFDRTKVHTLDIVMDDWDSFIETCENEEYARCNVVIDGEAVRNVGIRGKGNTSLSSVRNMDSSRYSFKIEFDQYDSTKSYHGLDKLCLNNIIQDNTYMKDYLAYTLMSDFGVDSPLCSYVYMTVNGEEWGLYLAVESIEDSFLQRNYGSKPGELYKPDSMSFGGGGPGNGKDFSMNDFMKKNSDEGSDAEKTSDKAEGKSRSFDKGNRPDMFGGNMPQGMKMPDGMELPDDFDPSKMFGEDGKMPDFKGFGGMGSDDVKLKYIDDDIDSYSNIFNNAKTDVTNADKKRLIRSLKALSEANDIESTVDVDEVIRYFAVHNFLCNGDSYTGMMIHNYYLYEKNGQLSMIPWDYNLAYGSFQGGSASSSVNAAIDTPVSDDMSDRPMLAWIFDSEKYTEMYHELFAEFIDSTDFASIISETADMIDGYVKKDPTKFCTYEEFQKGVAAISKFCTLRAESVKGQLDGTIPSTSDGQSADSTALIDTADLNISDMGSMGSGGGFGGKAFGRSDDTRSGKSLKVTNTGNMQPPGGNMPSDFDGKFPEGVDPSAFPAGEMPEGFDPSKMQGNEMPQGFDGNMPEGFTPPNGDGGDADASDTNNSSRPEMNGFPGMNGTTQKDMTTSYILLGVSAIVLLAGVVFALKFKR
ncbi:MAG: CotH kinase family protein [Oscillospiraceae bacterium]|nr:CotH kinase family protein [Oscillospiraceae bacterium]